MPEPYRTRRFPALGFELRWAGFQCDDETGRCVVPVHTVGLVGFDFDGMDRWVPVGEVIDSTVTDAERVLLAAVEEDPDGVVKGWRLLAAAFGLPWEVLDIGQVRRSSMVCWNLPERASRELVEQGVEGLLSLRRWSGRHNLSEIPFLLAGLGRYRENVGGVRGDWDG